MDVAHALSNLIGMPVIDRTLALPGPSTLTYEYLLELVSALTYNPPSRAPVVLKRVALALTRVAQRIWWPALSPDEVERRYIDDAEHSGTGCVLDAGESRGWHHSSAWQPFFSANHPQQDGGAAIVNTQLAFLPRALSPSPPLQRPSDMDSTTPPLTADEDEVDKLSHSSHSDQREPPPGQGEGVPSESHGSPSPCDAGEATPPLCSLSVFRAPDMLAFEDYLHRSCRLPTRLEFPDLLPSPDKWHDWSWGRLRAPVYVVPRRLEENSRD